MPRDDFQGTAYSYIRFSSREQEEGDSLRRQRELRDDWLKKHPAVNLDTTLGGEDRGVSAFRGANRSDKHHLGRFVDAVRRGRVAPGSILLLESLDRLSREEEEEALALLLSLINAGIIVVELNDGTVLRKGDGMLGLMRALVTLSRARNESAQKSQRMRKAWGEKQKQALEGKEIVTRRAPAWLEVVDGKFKFRPGAHATLKRIFRRCIEGQGSRMIAADLHKEDVEHFEGGTWNSVYIRTILRNPALIGRYQPMHRVNGKRVPNGQPVEGYYPAAVPVAEWMSAQKALGSRKHKGGRRGSDGWVALFGPINDARTGERLHAILRADRKRRYHVLQPAGVLRWQTKCVSFPLESFEAAILDRLVELDLSEVLPPTESGGAVAELAAEVADLEARVARIQNAMVDGDEDETALPVLRKLDEKRKAAVAKLTERQQTAASPIHEQWGTLKALAKAVTTDNEARLRVRAAAGRLIEGIDVLIVADKPNANKRFAAVQVRFRDRNAVRSYLIHHTNAKKGTEGRMVAARWSVRSFAGAALPDEFDLRKPADASKLEKALAGMDAEKLSAALAAKGKAPGKARKRA
jgi:DNA invertase Pin-like site-specific DNA recombinase